MSTMETVVTPSAGTEGAQSVFEVHLELFEGPLALLLHLIEKNNLNILDIPIAQITHEYIRYIDLMKNLNMDVTGEFLLMATTLMQVKTKLLLPRPEDKAAADDPRQELVDRLLMYQQFAQAARTLEERAKKMEDYAFRPSPVFEREEYIVVQNSFDLIDAFRNFLDTLGDFQGPTRAIFIDHHPVEAKIAKIIDMLSERETLSLKEIFKGEPTRRAMVSCFLAILELVKRGEIIALQNVSFGDIYLAKKQAQPKEEGQVTENTAAQSKMENQQEQSHDQGTGTN